MTRERLSALVVKSGVSIGGLADDDRLLALAIGAATLSYGKAVTETEVNARLKECLTREAAFLATDHVELRRWLVDTGWWRRDVGGRSYERVPAGELRESLRSIDSALDGMDLPSWVAECRAVAQADRARRHADWAARRA